MGRGTFPEVLDESGDPLGDPRLVDRSFEMSGTGQVVLLVFRDRSGDPSGGLVLVGGPSRRSGTLREVWDGLWDPQGGLGRVGGPTHRSVTNRRTLPEIRDELGDPP